MAIFMTDDTHGDFSRLRPAASYVQGMTKDEQRYELFEYYHDNCMINAKHILLWEQIVQICQDPYRQAVKERAAQRRFFLYCFATKPAK